MSETIKAYLRHGEESPAEKALLDMRDRMNGAPLSDCVVAAMCALDTMRVRISQLESEVKSLRAELTG